MKLYLNAWGHTARPGRSRAKLRKAYAECATDVVITINSSADARFRLFRPISEYRDAFDHLRELGVRPHVMTWIRPDVDGWIEPMLDGLAELREAAPFDSALLDAEGQWANGFAGGRPRSARQRLEIRSGAGALATTGLMLRGVPFGVTDIGMVSRDLARPLVNGADYVLVQCHEFGLRGGIRKPGAYTAWMAKRWPAREELEGVEVIPHLAAYGKTQTAKGLEASIIGARRAGFDSFGAWTSRRFLPRKFRRVLQAAKTAMEVCA